MDFYEQIRNKEYERIDDSTKNKLINNLETEIGDFIKNPIGIILCKYDDKFVIEYCSNKNIYRSTYILV